MSGHKANVELLGLPHEHGLNKLKIGQAREHLRNWMQITSDSEVWQNIAIAKYHFFRGSSKEIQYTKIDGLRVELYCGLLRVLLN